MTSTSEIKIEKQNLDGQFVDSWIDSIEEKSKIINFSKIHTITLEECQLDDTVSYDIFHDFVNITELNILQCDLDSKKLTNLLKYINPYSLSKLNLSGTTFRSFNEKDFRRISGLFSLHELVLPLNLNETHQKALVKLFAHPTLISTS